MKVYYRKLKLLNGILDEINYSDISGLVKIDHTINYNAARNG